MGIWVAVVFIILIVPFFACVLPYVTNGLVGYWKFDEGSSTSTVDSSGFGNNAVLLGTPSWTAGKSSYALSFNGSNYVDCGNAASLHVQSYTLAAWIKPSAINDSEHRIISNGGWANTNGAVDFLIDYSGRLVVLNQFGTGQDECRSLSGSLLAVGSWSFVAATYDAVTGAVKLYVNGIEVGTTLSTLRAPNPNPNWNMHIGVTGYPLNMPFKGSIDEVRVYNRALSPAEIGQVISESPPDWWPMFRHDLMHSGASTSNAPTANNTLWTYATGNSVYSSPSVVDGLLYVGSYDRKVYCINASTGAFVWSYSTINVVFSSPAVVDGMVYVGEGEGGTYGLIYCLNASTGARIWSVQTASFDARLGGVYSSPAVVDGRVYVGCNDGILYCLNASNGADLWGFGGISLGSLVSSPAVHGGLVYVGSNDGWVYCRNAANGSHVWSYKTGDGIYSSPDVYDGKLYIGSNDGKVYCLNATTGKSIWNYTTGNYVDSTPTVKDNAVYVGSWDGKVYCLNATTGNFVWSYTADGAIWFSSPAVSSGLVYIGSNDTKLYCLSSTSGSLVWSRKTGGSIVSSPTLADGAVYVGSVDNSVYAFWEAPPMSVTVASPENATYTASNGVALAYSTSEITSWVGYSLDGQQNATIVGNTTLPTLSEGGHRLVVYANDTSGKMGASGPVFFTVDLPPTGSITINNGDAYVNSTSVTLTLIYSDPGSGVNQVRYSNDGVSWSSWEAASPTKAWTLSSGEGLKTVRYQVRDNSGTISATYSDTITVDASTPRGSIRINNDAAYTNSTTVTLNLSAEDDFSSIARMHLANNWDAWTSWEPYATSKTWNVTPGDGEKNVYVQYQDQVNLTVSAYDTIILDMTKPTARAGQNQTVEVYTVLTFNGTGSTDNTGIATYLWDFGDGTTGRGAMPTHTYTSVGNYVVTLMVEDLAGNRAASTSSLTIVIFIPEFQPWMILPMLLSISLLGAVPLRQRKQICARA